MENESYSLKQLQKLGRDQFALIMATLALMAFFSTGLMYFCLSSTVLITCSST